MTMRHAGLAAVALAMAQPAAAAPDLQQDADQAATAIRRALDNPRAQQGIAQAVQSLTDTIMAMKVGELKALADGRAVTPADRDLTVRDLVRRDDPNGEAKLRQQLQSVQPVLRDKAKALAAAIPSLARNAEELGRSLERLGANIPDPSYPKR